MIYKIYFGAVRVTSCGDRSNRLLNGSHSFAFRNYPQILFLNDLLSVARAFGVTETNNFCRNCAHTVDNFYTAVKNLFLDSLTAIRSIFLVTRLSDANCNTIRGLFFKSVHADRELQIGFVCVACILQVHRIMWQFQVQTK